MSIQAFYELKNEVREYFDATTCGKGWQGTKPGCKRVKRSASKSSAAITSPAPLKAEDLIGLSNARFQFEKNKNLKQKESIKKELVKVSRPVKNKWGEVEYEYTGSKPSHEKKFYKAIKALKAANVNDWEISRASLDRNPNESSPKEVAKKALERRNKQAQREASREQKKKERQSYAQARQTVQSNINSLPSVEKALTGVEDRMVATNLRRRLEENLSNGSIKRGDFDKAFNAVSTSSPHKATVEKALKKAGVKIAEPPNLSDFEKVAPYEGLRKLTIKERSQAISKAASKLGMSEEEAFGMWRDLTASKAVERRKSRAGV